MEEGNTSFYAEIHTPDAIRLTYAPEGRCLGCNAKLSIYRTMTYGEWDKWCAPCQAKGVFELQCENCWETFPSFGTRVICAKCIVPSQRTKRHEDAVDRVELAYDFICRYGWSFDKTARQLEYESIYELTRAIERYEQSDE